MWEAWKGYDFFYRLEESVYIHIKSLQKGTTKYTDVHIFHQKNRQAKEREKKQKNKSPLFTLS